MPVGDEDMMLQNLWEYYPREQTYYSNTGKPIPNLYKTPIVKNMQENLAGATQVLTKQGLKPFNTAVAGYEYVAILFSSTKCGSSARFIKDHLTPFYNKVNNGQKKMAVINVSILDDEKDRAAAVKNYAGMPWFSAQYGNDSKNIISMHQGRGTPKLILFKKDGTLASENIVGTIKMFQRNHDEQGLFDYVNKKK